MYSLDPAVKIVWIIGNLFRTTFLTILIAIVDFFVIPNYFYDWLLPKGYTTLLFFILGAASSIFFPFLSYKFWRFIVRDDDVYIERGVLTRVKTTAPFLRIQHIDVIQSVLDRMFGLGKLVIYTAGTRGADVTIPGLPVEYAEYLRDRLKNVTPEDEV